MSKISVSGKADVNEFVNQAAKLAKSLDAGTALIYNDSKKNVQFYCYNGGDFIKAIPYAKPSIAHGYTGTVAAGGSVFKVQPGNNGDAEFLVKPNHAYVYRGKGAVEEVH